jgi:hypothetical protein
MKLRISGLVAIVLAALALSTPAHAATAPAALTWSLAQFDFGTVAVGQEGSQTFTLSNTGSTSSGTIAVTDTERTVFVITADGCSRKALGPSKSCSVTVEYAPTNTNGDTATLAATAEHAGASMNLFGNGTPNLVLGPPAFLNEIGPDGTKLYQADTGAISGGATQVPFTVSNTGTGTSQALEVVEIFGVPFFSLSNDTCSRNALAPNGMCTFVLTFTAPACSSPEAFGAQVGISGTSVNYIFLIVAANCVPNR